MSALQITPHQDFRPDPSRAVYIQGRIDQQLIDKLTPHILQLQSQNRDPITVYIDSPGGNTSSAETLLRILSAGDQNSANGCRLITVVTSRAASAAADLLSSGGYSIAYPDSVIFYHGVRSLSDDPITAESASFLLESLRLTNDRYAMALAARSVSRFVFRYLSLRSKFDEHRKNKSTTDLECFVEALKDRLSKTARQVIERAKRRNERYENLVERVGKIAMKGKFQRQSDFEAAMLKVIIDFERKRNQKLARWTFSNIGLAQVHDDFLLIREYFTSYESEYLKEQCDRWESFFLTETERKELEKLDEKERDSKRHEKLKEIIRPIWLFFVALCHALQEGEHELIAADAFWLGLIDEVLGLHGTLFPLRLLVEFSDQKNSAMP